MKTLQQLIVCMLGLFAFSFTGCSSGDDEGKAQLQILLTDSPGNYEEVNIDIQGIMIHVGDGDNESGWQSIEVSHPGVYDLLKLTNGLDTLMGETELPPGKISQVRLVLGKNNSVRLFFGKSFKLSTPSAQQSGLKLQVNEILKENVQHKILLDFDVARSVIWTGAVDNKYILKPVIRTITEAQGGSIKGIVEPVAATPAVFAIIDDDTVGTAYTDETGHFLIRGLTAGTYHLSFVPNDDYSTYRKDDVVVTTGVVTDVGTTTLDESLMYPMHSTN